MAMLAAPRLRKRYNLAPRGKALYEDGNRFGTRMLEKMGWEKGKGLGANENGQQDFVRVRYKHDSEGLGFVDRNDQWTEHERSFESLLETLNNGDANKSDEADVGEEIFPPAVRFGFAKESKTTAPKDRISGESLEEKSKKSRARVHYMKFTRGKDISRYSEKDLANIFGKKTFSEEKRNPNRYGVVNMITAGSRTPSDNEEEKSRPSFGVTTISTGTSVADYFKAKMAAVRSKLALNRSKTNQLEANNGDEQDGIVAMDNQIPEKEKKNRKKRKHQDSEAVEVAMNGGIHGELTDTTCNQSSNTEDGKSVKKKRKHKTEIESSMVGKVDESSESQMSQQNDVQSAEKQIGLGDNHDSTMPKKKSKRKDKNREDKLSIEEDVMPEQSGQEEYRVNQNVQRNDEKNSKIKQKDIGEVQSEPKTKVKKSKRKSNDEVQLDRNLEPSIPLENCLPDCSETNKNEASTQEESSRCKSKSKTSEVSNPDVNQSLPELEQDELANISQKKKSKRLRKNSNCENICSSHSGTGESPTSNDRNKSKKEKNKSNNQLSDMSVMPTPACANEAQGFEEKTEKKKSKSKGSNEESIKIPKECESEIPGLSTENDHSNAVVHNIEQSDNVSTSGPPTDQTISQAEPAIRTEFQFPVLSRRRNRKAKLKSSVNEEISPNDEKELDFKMNCYTAEKFCNVDIDAFAGSNFPHIVGYAMGDRINVKIISTSIHKLEVRKFYSKGIVHEKALQRIRRTFGFKRDQMDDTYFPAKLV